MNISELADQTMQQLRQAKDERVREHGPDANVPPTITIWRGGQMLAVGVLDGDVNSPRLRTLMPLLAAGLRADACTVAYEGWHVVGRTDDPATQVNPDTGGQWGEQMGELSEYVQRHGRDGRVVDAISVHAANAAGDASHRLQSMTLVRGAFGWSARWGESFSSDAEREDGGLPQVSGVMVDLLASAMAEGPRLAAQLAQKAHQLGTDPVAAEAIADGVCVREVVAARLAQVAILETPGSERARHLTRVLGHPPVGTFAEGLRWAARWN